MLQEVCVDPVVGVVAWVRLYPEFASLLSWIEVKYEPNGKITEDFGSGPAAQAGRSRRELR